MPEITLDVLPIEILQRIFRYLDIPDILNVRKLSRHLNEVGHSRDVWSDAYRKAKFIRPPGPFPSQSALYLESVLLAGFRLDRNLASTERVERKLMEIPILASPELGVSFVFGRFLLIAFEDEIRCYDLDLDVLDSNSSASIIYRPTDTILESFHCVSATDVEGRPIACIVVKEEIKLTRGPLNRGKTRVSIYSVKVAKQSEVILDLLHQFESSYFFVYDVNLGPRVLIVRGAKGFLDSYVNDTIHVALDLCKGKLLPLPSIAEMWDTVDVSEFQTTIDLASVSTISTSTHVLIALEFYSIRGSYTLLHAIELPHLGTDDDSNPRSTPFSLSHRSIISGITMTDRTLLHDAVFDASVQETLIAILVDEVQNSPYEGCQYADAKYGVLRLGNTHIDRCDNHIGPIKFQLLGSFSSRSSTLRCPSLVGTGRIFHANWTSRRIDMIEYDLCSDGNFDSGNISAEAKIIEKDSVLEFSTPRKLVDYDPYFGLICVRQDRVIEIYDLSGSRHGQDGLDGEGPSTVGGS